MTLACDVCVKSFVFVGYVRTSIMISTILFVFLCSIQLAILQRGLELLEIGGKVVYSTCSLNPLEDEAVVAAAISKCGGAVEIVETDLPGTLFDIVPIRCNLCSHEVHSLFFLVLEPLWLIIHVPLWIIFVFGPIWSNLF